LKVAVPLAPHCFHSNCSTNIARRWAYQIYVEFGKIYNYRLRHSAEFLWCSFCSGQRDKSCSHHFVLNLASQTSISIEFAPDCSWILVPLATLVHMDIKAFPSRPIVPLLITNSILVPLATLVHMDIKAFPSRPSVPLLITNSIFVQDVSSQRSANLLLIAVGYVNRAHFIHDSITLTSSEFDLVLIATRVRKVVKAFPSRPSVPLLITNSILEDASVTWIELDNIYNDR
ncbi:hypothetical protein T07_8567, partial [Trichinella nelsoni]